MLLEESGQKRGTNGENQRGRTMHFKQTACVLSLVSSLSFCSSKRPCKTAISADMVRNGPTCRVVDLALAKLLWVKTSTPFSFRPRRMTEPYRPRACLCNHSLLQYVGQPNGVHSTGLGHRANPYSFLVCLICHRYFALLIIRKFSFDLLLFCISRDSGVGV